MNGQGSRRGTALIVVLAMVVVLAGLSTVALMNIVPTIQQAEMGEERMLGEMAGQAVVDCAVMDLVLRTAKRSAILGESAGNYQMGSLGLGSWTPANDANGNGYPDFDEPGVRPLRLGGEEVISYTRQLPEQSEIWEVTAVARSRKNTDQGHVSVTRVLLRTQVDDTHPLFTGDWVLYAGNLQKTQYPDYTMEFGAKVINYWNTQWGQKPDWYDQRPGDELTVSIDYVFRNKPYEQGIIELNQHQYYDATFRIKEIPAHYLGMKYIRTSYNDGGCSTDTLKDNGKPENEFMKLSVNTETTVYVAYDARATTHPRWLDDWTDAGDTMKNTDDRKFNIYKKTFPAGNVVLGPNKDSKRAGSGGRMYSVFLSGGEKSHGGVTQIVYWQGPGDPPADPRNPWTKYYTGNVSSTPVAGWEKKYRDDAIVNGWDWPGVGYDTTPLSKWEEKWSKWKRPKSDWQYKTVTGWNPPSGTGWQLVEKWYEGTEGGTVKKSKWKRQVTGWEYKTVNGSWDPPAGSGWTLVSKGTTKKSKWKRYRWHEYGWWRKETKEHWSAVEQSYVNADYLRGHVFSDGNVDMKDGALVDGNAHATGWIHGEATGTVNPASSDMPPPDLLAQNYAETADVKVAEEFARLGTVQTSTAQGELGAFKEKFDILKGATNPAHIFARDVLTQAGYGQVGGNTNATNYFLGDWHNSSTGQELFIITGGTDSSGKPIPNSMIGNNKTYYVDGNLWVEADGYGIRLHAKKMVNGVLKDDPDTPVAITVVANGNVYVTDEIGTVNQRGGAMPPYKEDNNAICLIAMQARDAAGNPVERNEGSGNICFGDPNATDRGIRVKAFLYAENDFVDYALSGSTWNGWQGGGGGRPVDLEINGLMSAGGRLIINRENENGRASLTVLNDMRVKNNLIQLPGLPPAPVTGLGSGGTVTFTILSWEKLE